MTFTITEGVGTDILADLVGGAEVQNIRLLLGNNEVNSGTIRDGNPMPVKIMTNPANTGGTSTGRLISAASTNATSLKASAGLVHGYSLSNNGSSFAYLKLYNKASSPTVGTDTPVRTIMIPPEGGVERPLSVGIEFSTGIAYALTGGIADADTTAVAANQISVNIDYK